MKHNYALGIKKIIILWIVVFLGGYVLNSFFEKINSLDEGLKTFSKSHIVNQGFQIKYTYNDGKTYTAKYPTGSPGKLMASGFNKNMQNGQTAYGQGNSGLKQIDVSMIGNAPAPASVSGASNKNGCSGPTFGLTGTQMSSPGAGVGDGGLAGGTPLGFGAGWYDTTHRKLSKSECQMLKRAIDCTSNPQTFFSSTSLGGYGGQTPAKFSKKDNGVLPVVSYSNHAMGCVIEREDNVPFPAYRAAKPPASASNRRILWNVGCKTSGRTKCVGQKNSGKTMYTSGSTSTPAIGGPAVIWNYSQAMKAKNQGVFNTSLPSQVAKNNDKNNWDKFGVPIEAGDGIPR